MALAELAGIHLDPWQELVLADALGERADGRWTSFEVGLVVPRQNGKTVVLMARMLAGLFLFGERRIVYSAHLFPTARGMWEDLCEIIRGVPELHARVRSYPGSHGDEGVKLHDGAQLQIRARTKNGGRGLHGDTIILDEALDLSEAAMNALMPSTRAQPNPQLWFASSPPDIREHPNSLVLGALRERGIAGGDPRLTYLEWSAPFDDPDDPTIDQHDPQVHAESNPAYGTRVLPETFVAEQRAMSRRGFNVEILGVGDWPKQALQEEAVSPSAWSAAARDPKRVQALNPVAIAVDMPPDRRSVSLVLACTTADGHVLGEVLAERDGTAWVMPALLRFIREWDPVAVAIDAFSAALMFRDKLVDQGIEPRITQSKDLRDACGGIHDLLEQERLVHLGDPILTEAVVAAKRAPLSGGFKFVPKGPESISPLVGLSLAVWALEKFGQPPAPAPAPRRATSTPVPRTGSDLMTAGF